MNRFLAILFVSSVAFAQSMPSDAPTTSELQPSAPQPSAVPPPPASMPAPPQVQAEPEPAPAQPAVSGQWVYTQQYGWVWMPYGQQYVYTPQSGEPSMFIYYPSFGWRWVAAPWVWGAGPRPYFGRWGPRHYVWWGAPRFYRPYRPYRVYRFAPHRRWHRRW